MCEGIKFAERRALHVRRAALEQRHADCRPNAAHFDKMQSLYAPFKNMAPRASSSAIALNAMQQPFAVAALFGRKQFYMVHFSRKYSPKARHATTQITTAYCSSLSFSVSDSWRIEQPHICCWIDD